MKLSLCVVLAFVALAQADIYPVPEGTVVDQWHDPPMPEQLQPIMMETQTGPLLPSNLKADPQDLERAERDDDAFFAHTMPDMEADKVVMELEDARDAMSGGEFDSFLEVDTETEEDDDESHDDHDTADDHDEADQHDNEDTADTEDNTNNDNSEDNHDAPTDAASDANTEAAKDTNTDATTTAAAAEPNNAPSGLKDSTSDAPADKLQGILTEPDDATRDKTEVRLAEEADEDKWDMDNVDFHEGDNSLKNEFMDVMLELEADAEDHDDAHSEIHLGEEADAAEDEHHEITLDDAKEILVALDINPVSE